MRLTFNWIPLLFLVHPLMGKPIAQAPDASSLNIARSDLSIAKGIWFWVVSLWLTLTLLPHPSEVATANRAMWQVLLHVASTAFVSSTTLLAQVRRRICEPPMKRTHPAFGPS